MDCVANYALNPFLWLAATHATKPCAMKDMQGVLRAIKKDPDRFERAAVTPCRTFRLISPVHLTGSGPGHGAEPGHHLLPVAGRNSGHYWPGALLHRDLCPVEFLGLFRTVGASADLPQPGLLDILVPGEPHCV